MLMDWNNLDSNNIYILCHAILQKVTWLKLNNDSEYTYIGIERDFKEEIIKEIINDFFNSEFLYLSLGRKNSKKILLADAMTEFKYFLPEISKELYKVILVSSDLSKVLEFNSIGVVRRGFC
ncbi:hypothetical protein LEP1GSC158_3411 [Leptospira interrogans serovar Zanoni str. LT2156]|uniref:Uncharacterized protein n=1 Tax=Leptospira interrogans serovar Zanoni str. LT2156 TaxID=1001601 RepID=M6HKN8_LEPIR|nr:hypothetical protein LEP1GSC158_3411 [Leptospira interrogans serovar Zanoni str. LT2156]